MQVRFGVSLPHAMVAASQAAARIPESDAGLRSQLDAMKEAIHAQNVVLELTVRRLNRLG